MAAALNALGDVATLGGVTVVNFTRDGGYVIQFGSTQQASTDSTLSAQDLEIALKSLPTVFAVSTPPPAGDPALVARLLTARKHLGLMLPLPVQAAMAAALEDDAHVAAQKELYRGRRDVLRPAVESAGIRVDASEAGLYLWATEGRDAWESLGRLADLGILAGPGHFYGTHFPQHIRLSLTATDERIAAAAARLRAAGDGRR